MAINTDNSKYYLLSSQARVQVPFVRVTIGDYSFGAFSNDTREQAQDSNNFYLEYGVNYPNYIQSLQVVKINGKVNQYTLVLSYPITQYDDPNFIEKVLSSVSKTRKIVFSYGDTSMPSYIYKNEEALITKVNQSFNLEGSVIQYTIYATSSSVLGLSGSYNFIHPEAIRPSEEIKRIFRNNSTYGLQDLFTGMSEADLDYLIEDDDKKVVVSDQLNISILDYLSYLVNCMIPDSRTNDNLSNSIYILTIHDNTTYDKLYDSGNLINGKEPTGPYFKVSKVTSALAQTDAFIVDVGYNTSTIVTNFSIENSDNYAIYYDYQTSKNPNKFIDRIDNTGNYSKIFAPVITSNNEFFETRANDISWYSKITKYPINATITIQGLLRPATLMSYVRLNVIFPGGHKHISSGLYIVTKQIDTINEQGYKTQLSLTKIDGDELFTSKNK